MKDVGGICPDELQRQRNAEPQHLPPATFALSGEGFAAAHADAEEPKPVLPWWFGELDEVKRAAE